MDKYRKKPVVIEAEQFTEFGQKIPGLKYKPMSMCIHKEDSPHCETLEGPLRVSLGDWIIKGVNGEYYPCKPDIFEKTYEKI